MYNRRTDQVDVTAKLRNGIDSGTITGTEAQNTDNRHLMGNKNFAFDWLIFIPIIVLLSFGLATLLSLDRAIFGQQLVFALIGLGVFLVFSRIDFRIYQYLDRWIYTGSIIFLLLTFLGPSVRGSTRWLSLFGMQIQPSEMIKPFLLLSFSSFFVRFPPTKPKRILIHLLLFLLPFILVFRQPDLGNAIVYASMWLALIVLAGIPVLYLVVGGLLFGIMLPLGYKLLHNYQKLRILTFLDPFLDPQGAGYNAIQSMIAVGSGQLLGRGFGRGTQTLLQFLPEYHTDFIFATLGEEFGFIGGMAVLLLFFTFFWHVLRVAQKTQYDQIAYLYICGFFMLLLTHVVINIGMNMGVLPITGITLPFLSYGGSSMLSLWIGLGILMAARQKPPLISSQL